MRPDDIAERQLLPEAQPVKPAAFAFPTTPARSSGPAPNPHTGTRGRQKVQALQEVVTYGILKTAKKASAKKAGRNARDRDAQMSPLQSRLPDLEKRHDDLLSRISDLESRYHGLLSNAERM